MKELILGDVKASEQIQSKGCYDNLRTKKDRPLKPCRICEKPHSNSRSICGNCNRKVKKGEIENFKDIQAKSPRRTKICRICEKPHRLKTTTCGICKRKLIKHKLLMRHAVYLKQKHADVWKFIEDNPKEYLKELGTHTEMISINRNVKKKHYQNEFFDKTLDNVPYFVIESLKKYPERRLIGITGKKLKPTIHFVCERCNQEQALLFSEFIKGHNCVALKSSGEVIVERFLKEKGVLFKTQFDTLKCINPKTKARLPYDIEVTGKNLLIEIQGAQHYKFNPYFHKDLKSFEYQQYKDDYKLRYAQKMGYKLIYINYDHISSGLYTQKLSKALMMK